MKLGRKKLAFILTCLCFSPLLLFAVFNVSFQSHIKGDEQLSLVLSQFIASGQMSQPSLNQAPPAPQPEKIKPKKHKQEHKKKQPKRELDKHARKTIDEKPQEEFTKSNPIAGGAQLNNNAQNQIGTLAFGKDDNPFLREIKKAIDRALLESYPRQALKMRLTGEVLLEFVWLQNKSLGEVKLISSSGHRILDSNTLKVIAKAAREFPAYKENVRIQIPIVYNIKD